MSKQVKIQERLKDIAAEMQAILECEDESLSEQNEQTYAELEKESVELVTELDGIRADETKKERQQKADDILAYAKQGTRVTGPNKTGPHIGRVRAGVEDDPKKGFQSLGHFAAQVYSAGHAPRSDESLMRIAAGTGMQQSVSSDGGVLIPPAFSKGIWEGVQEESDSLLQYCDVMPVDPGVESITIPASAESSRVDGSRHGGIRGYWKGELDEMTGTKITHRPVKFEPQELYVLAYISDKLLRNSPSTAGQRLEKAARDEISFKIGASIFAGTGTGQPRGFLNHASTLEVGAETGQDAGTLLAENVDKMWMRCHRRARQNSVWFVNQDVEAALASLKYEIGTAGVPVYLPAGGLSTSPYATLKGRPIIPIEYCETLGTKGDIVLANLMYYGVAVKTMADSAWSMHLKFDFAQSCFRIIFEIDGQPWLDAPITPYKGTTTTSPIVTLATRS